jgi:hypothetical protein
MNGYVKNYSSENTALLIVDPFNDFLSEGGKLWSTTKETVKGVNLILITCMQKNFLVLVPHQE